MYSDGPRLPRLKAHLAVRLVAPDKVFLLSETSQHMVRDEAAVAVVPLLDGTRTVPEIAAAVASQVSLARCLHALAKLHHAGHLADGSPVVSSRWDALWEMAGTDPAVVESAIRHKGVEFVALGKVPVVEMQRVLGATGIKVVSQGGAFTIVAADDYLDPRLSQFADRPWLLVKPVGAEVWIGPYFRPDKPGCWQCMCERLTANRPVTRFLRRYDDRPLTTSVVSLPHITGIVSNLVAGVAMSVLSTGASTPLDGAVVSYDTTKLTTERHELIPVPHCSHCGDPDLLRAPPQVKLTSRPASRHDGGFRTEPAEATLRRLDKHVDRLFGAVTAVRPLSDVDLTPSYIAGHNFAIDPDDVNALRRTLRGQSGGKGRTDVQARVSATCEAIERYCGVWTPGRQVVRGTYAELGPEKAVAAEDLLLFSTEQYANRHAAATGRLQHVPEPLDHARPIDWTSAWSLTHDQERLLPAAYTWFGHPDTREHPFCAADSNGNAAGNTIEEAILQGFLEVVERDSVALWWYNRVRRPGVELASLNHPYVAELLEHYERLGRELWMLDISADLGIPSFAAVSRRVDHPVEDVLVAFGAHLDAGTAALRALTELNQFLPAVVGRSSDGSTIYREEDASTLDWWRTVRVCQQPWLIPDLAATPTRINTRVQSSQRNLRDDVFRCVELAASAGLEVIVCDQTRADIELNVVKVVVPGMRHFWRRLAPGRLYDVPVTLGWIEEPIAEKDLNPLSVFF
ncbi:TOMM precursor leader peptide-binding protein [Lentzea sp. NPDC006480]|uniref:TOMM precursor leader peptide-binding protein n=1 Tax=Lentzea sp. NPDC006480 TaxID=3157176 RepID=UPI0033AC4423